MSGNEKEEQERPRRRVVVLALLCGLMIAVATPGCSWKRQLAMDDIELAWDVNNWREVDPARLRAAGVPKSLTTKQEIVLYLFNKAAKLDAEGSAAYYHLGIYWIDKDCDQSRMSFEKQLTYRSTPDLEEMVRVFKTEGCEAARRTLRKQLS